MSRVHIHMTCHILIMEAIMHAFIRRMPSCRMRMNMCPLRGISLQSIITQIGSFCGDVLKLFSDYREKI